MRLNLSNTGLVATEDTAQVLPSQQTMTDSGAYCVFQGLQLVHLNLSTTEFVATENTVQALTTFEILEAL